MAYKQISPIPAAQGGTGAKTFTANGVLCGNGTSGVKSAPPTRSGAYLCSQGSGVTSAFTNGNSFVLITSKSAVGGASTVPFTSAITSTYSTYFLLFTDLSAASGHTDTPVMRWSTNNGSTYVSTGYQSSVDWFSYNSTSVANFPNTDRMAIGASPVGGTVGTNGFIWMHNLTNGANAYMYGQAYDDDGGSFQRHMSISSSSSTTNVNAFEIFWNGGATTFGTGTFSLYGLLE